MAKDGIARVAPEVRLLARHAPPRPDQRGRGDAARGAPRRATSRSRCSSASTTATSSSTGAGSSYRSARLEIVTMRVRATAATPRPKLTKARKLTAAIPQGAPSAGRARSTGRSRSARSRRRSSTARRSGPATASRARASSRRRRPTSSCRRGGRCGWMRSATSRSCSSEAAHAQAERDEGRQVRRQDLRLRPAEEARDREASSSSTPEYQKKIDPITYEVVRHNLWNINEELGMTIQRISGSPVAMYAFDLNSSIFTEDGEFIYYGPYQLYMSGVSDVQVKWTLEHRSDNPGIHDGDMFLANDPWVGAAHQMDVTLLTARSSGRASSSAGSPTCCTSTTSAASPRAASARARATPSTKASCSRRSRSSSADELRRDIEEAYLRASRKPVPGGARPPRPDRRQQHRARPHPAAHQALRPGRRQGRDAQDHRQRRGAPSSTSWRKLPDGIWRERTYVEVAAVRRPRDATRSCSRCASRATGSIFDNAGTAPPGRRDQHHLLGLARLDHDRDQRAAVLGPALRHRRRAPAHRVRPDARARSPAPRIPASVSTAPVQAMEISLYPAYNMLSKMLSSDPEHAARTSCASAARASSR